MVFLFCFFFEKMSSPVPIFACYVICSCRKTFKQPFTGVLNNLAIFTGKNLCWSLFLIKFQDWRPTFLFKKRLEGRCFSVNIATFLRAAFLLNTCSLYLFEFRVIFYYCKIRPRKHKNFATDRPKLVFRYLNISLLQRFVSSSNCKEKLVALNWTILVSNFSKYI